jgi:hypothetical protein
MHALTEHHSPLSLPHLHSREGAEKADRLELGKPVDGVTALMPSIYRVEVQEDG